MTKWCLENILAYGIFDRGKQPGDWCLDELHDKTLGKDVRQFTLAEKRALLFFEEMENCFGEKEKWVKPYGDVLNEHRNLH